MNALEFRKKIHIKNYNSQFAIVNVDVNYYKSIGEPHVHPHYFTNLKYNFEDFVNTISNCLRSYVRYKLWESDGRS